MEHIGFCHELVVSDSLGKVFYYVPEMVVEVKPAPTRLARYLAALLINYPHTHMTLRA